MSDVERVTVTAWRKQSTKTARETTVQAAIRQYLREQRLPHALTDATLTYNVKGQKVVRVTEGWPDLTTLIPEHGGRLFAIECKRPVGGKLSYKQAMMLHWIHQAGGCIVVARSVADVVEARTNGTRLEDLEEIARVIARGPQEKRK